MKFLNELEIKIIDTKNSKPVYQTLNDFRVEIYQGYIITVVSNIIIDFASTPRIIWNIYPPIGDGYWRIALLHDYLYRVLGFAALKNGKIVHGLSRKLCDQYFYEGIIYECETYTNLSRFRILLRAKIMYIGVRLGGWITWNKYKKELLKNTD